MKKFPIQKILIPALLLVLGIALLFNLAPTTAIELADAPGYDLSAKEHYHGELLIVDEIGHEDTDKDATYYYLAVYQGDDDGLYYGAFAAKEGSDIQKAADQYAMSEDAYIGDLIVDGYFSVSGNTNSELSGMWEEVIDDYSEVMEELSEYLVGEKTDIYKTKYILHWFCGEDEDFASIAASKNSEMKAFAIVFITLGIVIGLVFLLLQMRQTKKQKQWVAENSRKEDMPAPASPFEYHERLQSAEELAAASEQKGSAPASPFKSEFSSYNAYSDSFLDEDKKD